jgi:two-component system sensor histidine kinase VicK
MSLSAKIKVMPQGTSVASAEKEKLQRIIAEVKEGVIIADTNQNVSLMNKSAEEMTGYGFVDAMGKPVATILKVLDGENEVSVDTYCPVGGVDIDGVVYSKSNLKLVSKSADVKVVNVTSQKIKQGSQVGLGCIITIEDTFGESELERMKLDFVSMSVHVLRTPLSILKGYMSFLNKEETLSKLDDTEAEYIKNSMVSVDDLVELVENLLDLTQVQSSGFRVKPKPIDLDKAVQNIVLEFKSAADRKGLKMVYAPSLYELSFVSADATRLKIVLRNLIGNAVRFTTEGTVKVTVSKADEEGFLQVSVQDTGKGIPKKNMPHLSKKIVESHGGKVWVDSNEGAGSTFHFTLPVHKQK